VIEASARRKAALWVAVVFLLGAALGGVVGYIFAHHSVSAATSSVSKSEPEKRARRVEQLTKELTLTDDQRQKLDGILSQLHSDYKSIREQTDAQMEQARQRSRSQVRAILTPEQQPKFEEFLKRLDEERKHNPPPMVR
jgi:Spy/CpxP family protein refolding chaperone